MSDPQNTRGVPGDEEEADTASGGAPERLDGHLPQDHDREDSGGDEDTPADADH